MTADNCITIDSIEELHELNEVSPIKFRQPIKYTCENCGMETITQYRSLRFKSQLLCRSCEFTKRNKGSDKFLKAGTIRAQKIDYQKRNEKSKETWLKKYGVDNPAKVEDIRNRMKNWSDETKRAASEKRAKTNLEKYGNVCSLHGEEVHKKVIQTCIDKYGVPSLLSNKKLYQYNNETFDSSWELLLYIYLEANDIDFEYHPKIWFTYEDENDGKTKKYYPDFEINGKLYEIKGEQFFDENDEPYDRIHKKSWKGKYDVIVKNDIKILRKKDLGPIFEMDIDIKKYRRSCSGFDGISS